MVLPEVILFACAIGTFCTTTIVVVPFPMTDRATGNDVTPKGFPRVCACATGSWGFSTFLGVSTGSDVTRRWVPSGAGMRSLKFGFPSLFSGGFFPFFFSFFFYLLIDLLIFFIFFFKYGKMKCFYNVTQVMLDFKR